MVRVTKIKKNKVVDWKEVDGGILAREKTNPLRQVRLTSAGLGISTDGWQTVRSAVTAGGVLAETVIGQFGSFVSMLIGSGNAVTQINTNGIAAGHANFNEAPFRVDMAGNLVANKLTANYASIANSNFSGGAIVGSSINVGNGKFVVNSSGSVYAADGTFQGTINAKGGSFEGTIYAGGEIVGGIITGALLRTSAIGERVEMSSGGLRSYDSNGVKRVTISNDGLHKYSGIGFWSQSGIERAGMYAEEYLSFLYAQGPLQILSFGDRVFFAGSVDFLSANVYGLQISSVQDLDTILNTKASLNSAASNMTFDPTTRNLKLWSATGALLAQANIPK